MERSVPHYVSVPVDEYCKNVLSHMEEVVEIIKKECPKGPEPYEPYITITGFKHILDKMKNIIDEARERVYISMSDNEFAYIINEIRNAVKRGVKPLVELIKDSLKNEIKLAQLEGDKKNEQ